LQFEQIDVILRTSKGNITGMKKTSSKTKSNTSAYRSSKMSKKAPYSAGENIQPVSMEPAVAYRSNKIGIIQQLEQKNEASKVIDDLVKITGMTLTTLASHVYEMTPKTLSSYRQKGKVLPTRSLEVSIKLQDLYAKGTGIFGDKTNFNHWLEKESYGLGMRKPINLLNTSSGIDLVYEELVRIEFGATA
jgi:putative toxin-antitoxin system antitoxin component (TIGR02293 family)